VTTTDLAQEEAIATADLAADERRTAFHDLAARLSRQSVVRHYDAYADIAWDDPEMRVDADDPRWALSEAWPLGATAWYRAQPSTVQSRIGLYASVVGARRGMQFENVLERGLLSYAFHHLRNGDPTFRYILHEVAEETHHSMMFQEFVNRSGMNPPGLPRHIKLSTSWVVAQARVFPSLFFFFVLGGEDPIDHVQREVLRSDSELPPILETIMRHHVTEEARHISFARHYLKVHVPDLSPVQRARLSVTVPTLLREMAGLMMAPPPGLDARFGVPADVIDEATRNRSVPLGDRARAVRKLRRLAGEVGLLTPTATRLWKRYGLWEDEAA
jgi:hypothetical protein